ncbi:MAG: T9SS type A sorting domain-containing protein [Bacteroidia bacterium]
MKKVLYILVALFVFQQSRAACTYSSNTTISAATFVACGSITVNTGVKLTVTGTVTVGGGTTLNIANSGTIEVTGDFNASGNSTVNYSGSGLFLIDGNMSLSGSLNMSTSGLISVAGNATFSGSSQVQGSGSVAVAGTSTASGSTDVFGWTSGSCSGCTLNNSNPTPITLLKFTASYSNSKVVLDWTTATETNNRFFTLEKSSDGVNFNYFADIQSKAPNGNSLLNLSYRTLDEKPFKGVSYYRLKQTDYDGKSEYFKAVSVLATKTKEINFSVAPNPNYGEFVAGFTGIENNSEVSIVMHDIMGKLVYSNSFIVEDGVNTINIVSDQDLQKGVYFCSLFVEETKHTVKVVVE